MATASSHKYWVNFLKNNWRVYTFGIFAVCLTDAMQVFANRILGYIIDFFSYQKVPTFIGDGTPHWQLGWLIILLLGSRVFLFLGRMGWRLTLARMTHWAAGKMRKDMWHSVRFLRKSDFVEKFSKGHLMSISTSDVNQARFIFGFTLVAILDVVFLGIITIATMISISPLLSFYSLIVLLFLPFVVKKLSDIEIERYSVAQESLGAFNDLTSQVVSTVRLQRLTQSEEFWRRRMIKFADEYRRERLFAVFTSLRYLPVLGSASIISYLVLFIPGIKMVFDGVISLGDFIAFQGLIFLLQDPMFELGFIISEWKKGKTSLRRLLAVVNREKEGWLVDSKDQEVEEIDEAIRCENLSFKYPDSDSPIFENYNLSLKLGERLGIHGPIGSGKSTLVKVLSGLDRNFGGKLFIHGKEIDRYQHGPLRNYIGHVPQIPFLFADSVRNNISMDRVYSDEELWFFLDQAGLKDDVAKFKDRLDTQLGEWGVNLSGGQKQRLTLARALARKPRVLFLDDCLSAVDTVTEDKILKNLDKNLKESSIVWVAHRVSTLKHCHRIEEMK